MREANGRKTRAGRIQTAVLGIYSILPNIQLCELSGRLNVESEIEGWTFIASSHFTISSYTGL